MASIVDTVGAQLEQVRPIMVELFESTDQISSLFKKNSKNITQLSRYLYRIPLQLYRGGNFRKYSADGGTLGKGTGMKVTSLQAGYFYSIRMYRVTDEQVDLSKNTKQSVVDVLAKTLSDAMLECAADDDIAIHGDGTGRLTGLSSDTNGTTTLVFAGATDTLRTAKLREGMTVDVWSADGSTKRALADTTQGPLYIVSIDEGTQTVTLNTTVTAIAATDILAIPDADAYGPTTLVTGSAGWPATSALTTAGGLTGDSFRHGIPYAHNADTSSYYLGKQRSAIPQLTPVRINGKGQPLTFAHGLLGLDKIRKKRNPEVAKGMIGIFPMAQRAVIFDAGVVITNKTITGDFGKSTDLMPNNHDYTSTFDYCQMTSYVSKRQPNDRVDFCNLKNWGRAEVFPGIRPYEKAGKTVFEGRGSDGTISAYQEFGFQSAYDFVCFDPGAEMYFDALEVPAGYQSA